MLFVLDFKDKRIKAKRNSLLNLDGPKDLKNKATQFNKHHLSLYTNCEQIKNR